MSHTTAGGEQVRLDEEGDLIQYWRRPRLLTPPKFVIKHNYSGQDVIRRWETPALPMIAEANRQTGLLMESLMATVAQSDNEAKLRIRAFLDRKTAKVKPA
jgi:hypothetical protein